jgi:hypothetical protein
MGMEEHVTPRRAPSTPSSQSPTALVLLAVFCLFAFGVAAFVVLFVPVLWPSIALALIAAGVVGFRYSSSGLGKALSVAAMVAGTVMLLTIAALIPVSVSSGAAATGQVAERFYAV